MAINIFLMLKSVLPLKLYKIECWYFKKLFEESQKTIYIKEENFSMTGSQRSTPVFLTTLIAYELLIMDPA